MSFSVKMPELGESVTEGIITKWLKKIGDKVIADEPLLEVSTDKVDTEIPAPTSGTLTEILAQEDETVQVGATLATISTTETSNPTPPTTPTPEPNKETPTPKTTDSETTPPINVKMPELGESVTEGIITKWLKKIGDKVIADEPLLEVSTDKVDTEIPAPTSGTLTEILAQEDETVQVGATLATISTTETSNPTPPTTPTPEPNKETPTPKTTDSETTPPIPSAIEISESETPTPYVTPLVRKLAKENGVDLNKIKGTGVGGRIRKQDVLNAANPQTTTELKSNPIVSENNLSNIIGVRPELLKLRGTTQKINRIRQITAKKTRESLLNSAQLTQTFAIDVTNLVNLRNEIKQKFQEKHGFNITYFHFIAKAVVEVLKLHPNINASLDETTQEITYHEHINLGIAVDTPTGLLSPVVHNSESLSLIELAKAISDLAERTRNNAVKPDELSGGTFTITNIGTQGALHDTPILVPPQAAILGTGAITKNVAVLTDSQGNDLVGIRHKFLSPLTYDHRLIDGADAGRFLSSLRQVIEQTDFTAQLQL